MSRSLTAHLSRSEQDIDFGETATIFYTRWLGEHWLAMGNGKTILVTAGWPGIGRAIAGRCSAESSNVTTTDINEKALSEVDRVAALKLDLMDFNNIETVIDHVDSNVLAAHSFSVHSSKVNH